MRFDTIVKFYNDVKSTAYDPTHSKQTIVNPTVLRVTANVTDAGTNRSVTQLGSLSAKAKVVRFIGKVGTNWSYLTIGDSNTKYVLVTERNTSKTSMLIVGEKNG